MNLTLTTAVLIAAGHLVLAQPIDTTGTPAAAQPPPNRELNVSGYVEAYYAHDFTAPKTSQERPGFLYNHRRNREVNVNLAFAKLAYVAGRVRGNLAVQVGTYPQYNYAAEPELVKNIFEANAGVKLSRTKNLWFDAGIFGSHIGFESAISKDCWTLTRSLVAETSPYYLAGAKLTYTTPNGKWTLLGSIVNGWQRIKKVDGYSGPSLSTQVQFRPSATLTLNWSSFLGSDRPDSLHQTRFFANFYAIWQATDRFGLIAGYDRGTEQKPFVRPAGGRTAGYTAWYSPVVIARYQTSDKTYLAGRVEYYDDNRGVITGIPAFQTWGYSLNYDYAVLPNALLRVEGKVYASKTALFASNSGLSRTNASLTTNLTVSF